jgi:hypothetical protein
VTPHCWSVLFWQSHPDCGNDDCVSGDDFGDEAEARACFVRSPLECEAAKWAGRPMRGIGFVQLIGPGISEVRANPDLIPFPADDDDEGAWRRERAGQAGMGLGIDAYNDEMGWS